MSGGRAFASGEGAGEIRGMSEPLNAEDLLPLVQKLPREEQVRLARLALRAASTGAADEKAYADEPPRPDEFEADEDPLAWEADGWEDADATR